ncbi:SAM-dependent methyltransferase [Nannocystaceae bacterium ST9]
MSWKIRDDFWLAPIDVKPETGVFDELDARVVSELLGQPRAEHSLPPPPPSAAFDEGAAPTSYESGRFMVDPEGEPEEAAEIEPESEPEPDTDDEPEMGFVIPNLARGSSPPPPVEPAPRPASAPQPAAKPEPEPEEPLFAIPSMRRPSGPAPVAGALIIPSLRKPEPDAPPVAALEIELGHPHARPFPSGVEGGGVEDLDEVEEVHELEEIVEQPVRTGDTVIGPAPTGPSPQDPGIASPIAVSHSGSVAESVYDDDDDDDDEQILLPALVVEVASPETIQRVDSAELEILPEDEDTAVGLPPEPDEGEVDDPRPFVIPSLAAASPAPVGGITPAEIVIPLLTRVEPEPSDEPIDDEVALVHEPEPASEVEPLEDDLEPEEVEEFEVEEPAAAGPPEPPELPEPDAPEVRPPTPPPSTAEKRRKAWYDDVFTEHYQYLYPPSWEETARRDAEFIHAVLGLPSGASLLDVGCGDGRHAIELAKLGVRVTGLDNSLALLLAAAQHKEQAGIVDDSVSFLHGDMRRLPRDREFDAVICVGSTLGYFEEEQNRHCLDEMLTRLAPKGRLLLHVFNRDFVAPQLPARSWWQGRRCMVLDEAEMNFFANRLRVHRTIIFDDGRQFEHYMFLRAFTVHDLGKSLSQMGMRVVEVSGSRDTRKRFYGSASPDIWIVAERKP